MDTVKDPKDRAHMWERPDLSARTTPVDTRRVLHKAGGDTRIVSTPEEQAAAIADGWVIDPNTLKAAAPAKKG